MNTTVMAVGAEIILGLFLLLYMLTMAIDVGGGALALWARWRDHDARVGATVLRYVSPVWETSNVFLIAFFVGTAVFFPGSVPVYGPILIAPVGIAFLLMLARGMAFTLQYYVDREGWLWQGGAAVTGALVPVFLVPFLAVGDLGSRLGARDSFALMAQPLTLTLMLVAATATPAIAATFLAWFAARGGQPAVSAYLRRAAIVTGGMTVVAAVILGIVLPASAPAHATGVSRWLVGLLLALVAGGVWLWKLAQRRPGQAFLALVGTVTLSLWVWLAGQWPFLARPTLRATDALVNGSMFAALAVTLVVGLTALLPLLGLFYHLFVVRWNSAPHETVGAK
jgi:cytochrome d ubiquinol oxidase subunit II